MYSHNWVSALFLVINNYVVHGSSYSCQRNCNTKPSLLLGAAGGLSALIVNEIPPLGLTVLSIKSISIPPLSGKYNIFAIVWLVVGELFIAHPSYTLDIIFLAH